MASVSSELHNHQSGTLFITPGIALPLSYYVPFFFPPSPRQLQVYFPSLQICPFWALHINGDIHYVILGDCLPSLSAMWSSRHIQGSPVSEPHLLSCWIVLTVWIGHTFSLLSSAHGHVACLHLGLWQIPLLWAFRYEFLRGRLSRSLREPLRGNAGWINPCSTFGGPARCSPKGLHYSDAHR